MKIFTLECYLVEYSFGAIMNLVLQEFLCILGIQYINERSFSLKTQGEIS